MYSLISQRFLESAKPAAWHLTISVFVSAVAAALVFLLWYPFPYRELSGGRELFMLVLVVDVVCGPLLTLCLYAPSKSSRELILDMSLIGLIQVTALLYGLWTVWHARPLYLVHEIDRFKVISAPDVAQQDLRQLPAQLQHAVWSRPMLLGLRDPKNLEEKNTVMLESVEGGRDFAERPEFYVPYDAQAGKKAMLRAKPLPALFKQKPALEAVAAQAVKESGLPVEKLHYLPVMARQDWVALLNEQGMIVGFFKGDGF